MNHARPISTSRLAPGPPGWPVLGNLLEVRRNPLEFMVGAWCAHGDIVRCRIGPQVVHLLSHPDHYRHVLQDHIDRYRKAGTPFFDAMRTSIGNGLLVADGDPWRRARRLAQPAFHRQRIAAFASVITRATDRMLARWARRGRTAGPVEMTDELNRLTLETVSEALFGRVQASEHAAIGELADRAVRQGIDALRSLVPVTWPTPRRLLLGRSVDQVHKIIGRMIADGRAAGAEEANLLSMLLHARDDAGAGMSDQQLEYEIKNILMAGYETTANALAWTFYLLATAPVAAQRLRTELHDVLGGRTPTFDDLARLPYARRVVEESMRIYPPAWVIPRVACEDDEISGYGIPKGSMIMLVIYNTHRHPGFWNQPEVFDPDRFAPDAAERRTRFAYAPFGGGQRQCIGNNFALMESQLVVAQVMQRYELALAPGQRIELEPLITLRPRHGLRMVLAERASS